jgi:predicted secreted protein
VNFTINHQQVDITNKDTGGWQTILESAGTKSVQISVEGVVDNSTAFEAFMADCQAGTIAAYRLEYGDSDIIEASFHPGSFQLSSGFDNEQTFSATLNSSGTVTFTNA